MWLSCRPSTSLILVVLAYVSNLVAIPAPPPGMATSARDLLELGGGGATSTTTMRSFDELHRIPPTGAPNMRANQLHDSYIPHQPELTQAQKDYIYGTSWGPGGKAMSFTWKKIKSMFSLMAKPFKYLYNLHPIKETPLSRAEIAALRDNVATLRQMGLIPGTSPEGIIQQGRPPVAHAGDTNAVHGNPAAHAEDTNAAHGNRRHSINSHDEDEHHEFFDAVPGSPEAGAHHNVLATAEPFHDAPSEHEPKFGHVNPDPQSVHQKPNEPQSLQPQPQHAPEKPNEPSPNVPQPQPAPQKHNDPSPNVPQPQPALQKPLESHDTPPANEAGEPKPKTDGRE